MGSPSNTVLRPCHHRGPKGLFVPAAAAAFLVKDLLLNVAQTPLRPWSPLVTDAACAFACTWQSK